MAAAEEDQGAAIPEWVVTFGDMMSLLLTFFVLLFSMSEVKQAQSLAMLESLRRQFGHEAAVVSPVPGRFPPLNSGMRTLASMGRARRLDTMNGGDKVRAPVGDYPRVRTLRASGDDTKGGAVYFAEGSAELTRQAAGVLRQTADVIRGMPQKIEVCGHTSKRPLPPDSPYKSHWELAFSRCLVVKDSLIELGIDPARIRLGVAADNEPVHVGPDPGLRKQNARVEVVLLPELVEQLDGPDAPPERGSTDRSDG
jgi:chemotaxis protein MotB